MAQHLTDTDADFHQPFRDDVRTSDPPPRRSMPSVSEVLLAKDDQSRDASLRPGMHPVDAYNAEMAARKRDNY